MCLNVYRFARMYERAVAVMAPDVYLAVCCVIMDIVVCPCGLHTFCIFIAAVGVCVEAFSALKQVALQIFLPICNMFIAIFFSLLFSIAPILV